MTEKMLHVILTSLIASPRIFLEQILNSKMNFKLLQNENGARYQKNNCGFENQRTRLNLIRKWKFFTGEGP